MDSTHLCFASIHFVINNTWVIIDPVTASPSPP